ncbi:tyrosine recombinase XerS [Aquibacillus sp. 3ASR75-11]|uniref:Tyrosine recombinase XerS n=1 Tax=Terrihalobacillus insolitus TaxID=2950438 RepID=A0A9X3WSX5_9BACI|nr:tyrosine recombinase XerS [Terrihalobacillus insolitus]MDC3424258.1 tyrosine recombinase XerS [Terrihalobacillus insolitus]
MASQSLEKQKHEKRLNEHLKIFPGYVKEYVQSQKRKNRSPSTLLGYIHEYKRFFLYLKEQGIATQSEIKDIPYTVLEKLPKDDMEFYIDYLREEDIEVRKNVFKKRSVAAVNRNISALTSLFNYLTTQTENEDGECYFYRNVMSKIALIDGKETASRRSAAMSSKILHDDSITEFLNFVRFEYEKNIDGPQKARFKKNKERDVAILSIFLGAGLRVSEIASLSLDSINYNDFQIDVVRKGDKEDTVEILPEALEDLRAYLRIRNQKYKATENDYYIFVTNYQGTVKPMSVRTIQNLVERYTKAFNQGQRALSPHKLRHSFAGEHLKRSGGNIVLLRDQLGHNSIETTSLYTNLDRKEHKKVMQNISKSRKSTD